MATMDLMAAQLEEEWAAGVPVNTVGDPNNDQKEPPSEIPEVPESTQNASDSATSKKDRPKARRRQHESSQADLLRNHNLRFASKMPIEVGSFTNALARIEIMHLGKKFSLHPWPELTTLLMNEWHEVSPTNFGATTDKHSSTRATLGMILEIQKAALYQRDGNHDKWVSSTVSRLLNLAKTRPKRTALVKVVRTRPRSVKTKHVRVQEAAVEQEAMPAGVKVGKRQGIEFALCMNPTSGERRHLKQLMQRQDFWTISALLDANLRDTPAAIPIHVQLGSSSTDSHLQLASWTLAQLDIWQRLGLLTGMLSETLNIPLISIRGPHWQLCVVKCKPGGKKTFYGEQSLGDMRKLLDIYKILATLRRLHRWINEVYRPWFQRHILTAHFSARSKRELEEPSEPEAKRVRLSCV